MWLITETSLNMALAEYGFPRSCFAIFWFSLESDGYRAAIVKGSERCQRD